MIKNVTIALAAFLATTGCGGDDDGTELEGVYVIDTWTENESGCDAEGPSILDGNDTHFYLKVVNVFGLDILSLVTCADRATCEEGAADDALELTGLGFDAGSDAEGWIGGGYTLGGPPGEPCEGEVRSFTMTVTGTDVVEVSIEGVPVTDVPLDQDGFCDSDAAREQAAGQGCGRLEVLTGTRVSEL